MPPIPAKPIPTLASARLLGRERQFAGTLASDHAFSDSVANSLVMQDEAMDTKELDSLIAIVYWGTGRSVENACWLLEKAEVPTPSGRKKWYRDEVAKAVIRHKQRKSDELESF